MIIKATGQVQGSRTEEMPLIRQQRCLVEAQSGWTSMVWIWKAYGAFVDLQELARILAGQETVH